MIKFEYYQNKKFELDFLMFNKKSIQYIEITQDQDSYLWKVNIRLKDENFRLVYKNATSLNLDLDKLKN